MNDFIIKGFVGPENLTAQQVTDITSIAWMQLHEDPLWTIFTSGGAKGTDEVCKQTAERLSIPTCIFYPHKDHKHWNCKNPNVNFQLGNDLNLIKQPICPGYQHRNTKIAILAHELYCFAVRAGSSYCHHCHDYGHVSSGGCYTMQYAKTLDKETTLFLI